VRPLGPTRAVLLQQFLEKSRRPEAFRPERSADHRTEHYNRGKMRHVIFAMGEALKVRLTREMLELAAKCSGRGARCATHLRREADNVAAFSP